MSSSRTNLTRTHLTLDEQSFQGLLSAAFTIQEHNDRRKLARQIEAKPEARREPAVSPEPAARLETEVNTLCPHCGAAKPAETARCQSCGLDEFRPGERMQRNWASMWLMSQEQGLWRSSEVDDGTTQEAKHEGILPGQGNRRPFTKASIEAASNGFLTVPDAGKDVVKSTISPEKREAVQQQPATKSPTRSVVKPAIVDPGLDYPQLDYPQFDEAPAKRKWPIKMAKDLTPEHLAEEDSTRKDSGLAVQSSELAANQDSQSRPSYLVAANSQNFYSTDFSAHDFGSHDEDTYAVEPASTRLTTSSANGTNAAPLLQRFADLRVTLRFHRADLYLGIAVFVAFVALLWPAAVAPRKATLSPWDRALLALGIAEAPAPVQHFQGDPTIEVWVDPHTALYYCPGEEPYGKTADGRFSSQREAQMDRFESANRSACE
jgi:hypothetical protein